MTCLLDTNSLVYYYRGDVGARAVEELLATDRLAFVTNLTIVELRSTLAKCVRDAQVPFNASDYQTIDRRFSFDCSSLGRLRVHPLRRRFVDSASKLIEEYGLNRSLSLHTLDALQLSGAVDLQGLHPDLEWVTADQRLQNIAACVGIAVIDPRRE